MSHAECLTAHDQSTLSFVISMRCCLPYSVTEWSTFSLIVSSKALASLRIVLTARSAAPFDPWDPGGEACKLTSCAVPSAITTRRMASASAKIAASPSVWSTTRPCPNSCKNAFAA